MTWSLLYWLVPVVLLSWAVGAHNRLTLLRAAVLQGFAVLDSHLQAWIGLAVPLPAPALEAAAAAGATPPAVPASVAGVPAAAVPGPASTSAVVPVPVPATDALVALAAVPPGEAATGDPTPLSAPALAAWAGLRAAALQLQACLLAARQRPLERDRIAALSAARDVLRAAWRRLLADAPPQAGMPHAGGLHVLWDQGDTQVQLAAEQFNQAVQRYNEAQSQFPAALLAWILRLSPARTL